MPAWLVWAVFAVALAIGEILTPGLFFLGPVAVAAIAAAAAAALGGGWVVDLVVFVAGSALSLGVLRPVARRHLKMPHAIRTGAAALVGARAVVVDQVDMNGGHVKIGGKKVSIPSYPVKAGEVIALSPRLKENVGVKLSLETAKKLNNRPSFLEFDETTLTAKVLRIPERAEMSFPINDQLIIEYYSR